MALFRKTFVGNLADEAISLSNTWGDNKITISGMYIRTHREFEDNLHGIISAVKDLNSLAEELGTNSLVDEEAVELIEITDKFNLDCEGCYVSIDYQISKDGIVKRRGNGLTLHLPGQSSLAKLFNLNKIINKDNEIITKSLRNLL